ncbi:hypothetical protein APHAL10511_001009 [Amanita phalloides]|nr:hypothetical protein APHAL10511_001009 [Amanita phalloides]
MPRATLVPRRALAIVSALPAPISNIGRPLCRQFHSSIPLRDVYKNADHHTFMKVTQAKDRVILIDFYANWCRPCHQLSPILEKLCSDASAKSGTSDRPLDLLKIDVESKDGSVLAQQYGVTALPTVFAFRDGKTINQFRGSIPEHAVREFIKGI